MPATLPPITHRRPTGLHARAFLPWRADTAAAPGTRRPAATGWVVAGLLCAASLPAPASVRALPPPPVDLIERAAVRPALPASAEDPDHPTWETKVQALRAAAQGDRIAPTPPSLALARRATSEISPPNAAWLLGLLALHGLAMPTNPAQAQQWFERAHMLGHPLAPAGLAWCQIAGCVTRPQPTIALHWIAVLHRTEPGLAKYLEWHASKALAPLSETLVNSIGQGPVLPPPASDGTLRRLLTQASRAGNAQARNELGLEYVAAGEMTQALAQFNAAAAHSAAALANATLVAQRMLAQPPHTPGNETRASPASAASAAYLQARRYHRGDGVPANYTEAVRLYRLAAAQGDARARHMLALIVSRPLPDSSIDIAWMQQLAAIAPGTTGQTLGAAPTLPDLTPAGWQRDPSPLYERVPAEWRAAPALAPR